MSMFVIAETLPRESKTVALPAAPSEGGYASVKVALDFALALVLLVFTAPLILMGMLLVKLTSPGPAIYSQTRLGRNGKPFTIYKLRTMAHDCENLTGAQWCKPGDKRVTPIGRWLRKTHVDELPQLWNVLCGDMSLVGPRPERPEFLPALEQAIPCYRERLRVRPGVTGFAQIQLPPDTDMDSVRIKLAYDLHYVLHAGFWFDLRIYAATLCKVMGMPFDAIRAVCCLPRRADVATAYQRMASP